MTTQEAYEAGYYEAKNSCLRLLAKWFFMKNKDARSCRDEMLALSPMRLKP